MQANVILSRIETERDDKRRTLDHLHQAMTMFELYRSVAQHHYEVLKRL